MRIVPIILLSAAALWAQGERSTITGAVTDTSGGVVPGALIKARNVETNVTITAESNTAGIYVIPALPPGRYDVTVEKSGFRTFRTSNLPLSTNLTATVNARLEVGQLTESVQVEANAVQLEMQTSGLGKTVESRRIHELPMGRGVLNMASLAPGVIPTSGQQGNGGGAVGNASNSRVSGGLAQQNSILVDGGESRGFTSGGQSYMLPNEAVEEVKIETSAYSSEFGNAAGGVFQVVSRSGTNEYHGVLYEFFRNDHLNANGWQNNRNRVRRGQFTQNQFGVAAGGRIIRDKTFFYLNYEGYRTGSPDNFLATVPTEAQKAGDFSQSFDPTGRPITVYDFLTTQRGADGRVTRSPFPGNRVPSARIHPISQKVLGYWPAPNRPGETPVGVRNYLITGKNVNPVDIWFARLDHFLSAKHRLYGRTGGAQNDSFSTLAAAAFPARTINSQPNRAGLVVLTSNFTPNILGEFRVSYSRLQSNNFPVSEGFDMGTLGFGRNVTDFVLYKQFPQITVQQYNSGSGLTVATFNASEVDQLGGATKTLTPQDTWHAQYHATWIKQRHKFRFGTDWRLYRGNLYNSQFSAGQYFFDRAFTQGPDPAVTAANSGHGFASLLLGVPAAGTLTFTPRMFLYQRYRSAYFHDDIRLTNRLTMNIGMRYEYTSPYGEKHGAIGYLDRDATEPVTGGKGVFKWVPPGGYHTDPNYKTFSPRLGFAFQLDSKTVIRTGAAIFYATNNGLNAAATDFGTGLFTSNFITLGPPNPLGPQTPPVGGSWTNPFAAGFDVPEKGVSTFAGQNIRIDYKKHPLAYVGNWNFSIQRQLSGNMIAEIGYVGSKITHLFWNRMDNGNDPVLLSQYSVAQLNEAVPNPYFGKVRTGALSFATVPRKQLLRPYPHYQQVLAVRQAYGDSNYQSMIARFEKRYSQGLTVSASYTMSKSIASTAESNTWVVGPSNAYYDPKYNRSLEANDTPHRVVISHIWDLPFGKGRRWVSSGPLTWVAGGWQMNGISVFQSGRPVLITGPDTTQLYDFSYTNGRTDRLKSGKLESGQTIDRWFDTSAFRRAAPGTVPTDSLSQPDLRGPGRTVFDMSFFKNTKFRERYTLQFRAEFYNIFNTPQFEMRGASTEITNADFGRVILAGAARNIWLGMKLMF